MEYLGYISLGFGVLAVLWAIFLTIKIRKIEQQAGVIFDGANGKKISIAIESYFKNVKEVEDHCFKLDKELKNLKGLAELGLTRVGFLRYNPFGDIGSNQSFSLCLLDSANNGFVITSIHSREGTRVYSKSIEKGESQYNLSQEELTVVKTAKK